MSAGPRPARRIAGEGGRILAAGGLTARRGAPASPCLQGWIDAALDPVCGCGSRVTVLRACSWEMSWPEATRNGGLRRGGQRALRGTRCGSENPPPTPNDVSLRTSRAFSALSGVRDSSYPTSHILGVCGRVAQGKQHPSQKKTKKKR